MNDAFPHSLADIRTAYRVTGMRPIARRTYTCDAPEAHCGCPLYALACWKAGVKPGALGLSGDIAASLAGMLGITEIVCVEFMRGFDSGACMCDDPAFLAGREARLALITGGKP